MNKKIFSGLVSFIYITAVFSSLSYAEGGKEAFSSLLLPTTGQAMNGELSARKTKIMAGVEVASITAVTILGIATGGAAVLFGAVPLVANHLYSAADAYKGAQYKQDPLNQQQMMDAQRNVDYSRQRRFEREQSYRNDIRERIKRASEQTS